MSQMSGRPSVLVCSGSHIKIPETEWLINNKHLFLTVLEAGKSKIMALADVLFGEGPPLVHSQCLLFVISHGGRDKFHQGTNPSTRLCPYDLMISPRLHFLIPYPGGT